jgi:uncharacterized protein YbjT (DUF2867 family)
MQDKLVTLIGGGGFIGRYVAQELLASGARVRIVERDPRRAWFLKPLGGLGQTQFAAADVTRPETIARAVTGSDAVVYLVGTWGPDFDAVQVRGVRVAAEAAAASRAHAFVHVSTIGADPESPSRYYASKGAGEAALKAAFPAATILRPSVVAGPEDRFVNRFAEMTLLPVVPVLRAGVRFQPVFVADVAKAVRHALADPAAHGGKTYELAGPEVLTMGELVRWLAKVIGRDPIFADLPDIAGNVLSMIPGGPISRDQWRMLQTDNVATGALPGLHALGVAATPIEAVAPAWLERFHKAGRFGVRAATAG